MASRNKPEERLHRAVVQGLRLAVPEPPIGPFWYHPHNEGHRSKAEAGVAKALGQKAGNPDLWFVWAGEGRRPFAIELKAPKGATSTPQREAHRAISDAGCAVYICRTLEEVTEALQAEGVPLRAHLGGGHGR